MDTGRSPPSLAVSERLGHTKIAMTLDIYAHVLPAQDRAAATAFGDLLSDPAPHGPGLP